MAKSISDEDDGKAERVRRPQGSGLTRISPPRLGVRTPWLSGAWGWGWG